MEVAVRELKAKLSAYLRQASTGEIITVTDRGKPIAQLRPIPGRIDLDEAVKAGWLSPATTSGLAPVERRTATRSVRDVLEEDRSE